MTRFHVTLDGEPRSRQLSSDLRKRLGTKGTKGSINKGSSSGRRAPSINDRWQHDLFEELEQGTSEDMDSDDLRHRMRSSSRPAAVPITSARRGGGGAGARIPTSVLNRLGNNSIPARTTSSFLRPESTPKTNLLTQNKTPSITRPKPASIVRVAKVPSDSNSDMNQFLTSLGLDRYTELFGREEVDLEALKCLSDEDMQTLGIPMGPRKKILAALN